MPLLQLDDMPPPTIRAFGSGNERCHGDGSPAATGIGGTVIEDGAEFYDAQARS
jgi:hypothetical protein